MGEKRIKIDVGPEMMRQLAVKRARGVSLDQLEQEYGLSRPVITRTLASDEARQVMLDVMRDEVAIINAQTRKAAAELGPLAIEVIRKKLEEGDLKAVEPALKASGILVQAAQDKGEQKQAQQIIVTLPGSKKDIKSV